MATAGNILLLVAFAAFAPDCFLAQLTISSRAKCSDNSWAVCDSDTEISVIANSGRQHCFRLTPLMNQPDAAAQCAAWESVMMDRANQAVLESRLDEQFIGFWQYDTGVEDWKQMHRTWSAGKWNKKRSKYVWPADEVGLTAKPTDSSGIPFYYAVGDLDTKGRNIRRCLTMCGCYRKIVKPGVLDYSYVRADCKNDLYHAVCGKYGSVCSVDGGAVPTVRDDLPPLTEEEMKEDLHTVEMPSHEELLSKHDPALDHGEETKDDYDCHKIAEEMNENIRRRRRK